MKPIAMRLFGLERIAAAKRALEEMEPDPLSKALAEFEASGLTKLWARDAREAEKFLEGSTD